MEIKDSKGGHILLPDFLVVGAAKAATTSLYFYLNQHPDVCMTSIKENWFFSFYKNPPEYNSPGKLNNVISGLDDYIKQFSYCRRGQILGDASPSYLYTYEDTINNIRAIYPPETVKSLKIIISLRDPVSRAFSQYNTFRRKVEEPLEFKDAVKDEVIARRLNENWNIFYDYTGFGNYYSQVKAFIEEFGQQNVFVTLYDDIKRDPVLVCRQLYDFLGVSTDFSPDVTIKYNKITGEPRLKWFVRALASKNPVKRMIMSLVPKFVKGMVGFILGKILLKKTEVNESTLSSLQQYFYDDITRLEDLIGRDLSDWKHSNESAPSNQ